jgi:putative ATPase
MHARVASLSAVTSGVADLRKIVDEARRIEKAGVRTCLVVDEVHRWNSAQQDALLPSVESGTIVLIGLTSENPYFDLIPALRSRVRILHLNPLQDSHIRTILERAMADTERGLGNVSCVIDPDALNFLAQTAGGDARIALNGLEAAVAMAAVDGGIAHVTTFVVEDAIQRRGLRYDRDGDDHYQTISALIKSIRGSDPDAAVFWLAKMLGAGDDPRFIARRLVISASEDTGTARSMGLVLAEAAASAVEHIGMPESGLILAHAAIYLASTPKSNATAKALWSAQATIERGANLEVPLHLRNQAHIWSHEPGFAAYDYSHDHAEGDPKRYQQRYLPEGVAGPFYVPTNHGDESAIKERLDYIGALRIKTNEDDASVRASGK